MALSTTTGAMTTKVVFKKQENGFDADGFPVTTWVDIFSSFVWCYWINAAGTELDEYQSTDLKENATLTLRYTDKISVRDRVYVYGEEQTEENAWDVIAVNNGKRANKFVEVKVRRVIPS